jgi:hypothetical protein
VDTQNLCLCGWALHDITLPRIPVELESWLLALRLWWIRTIESSMTKRLGTHGHQITLVLCLVI